MKAATSPLTMLAASHRVAATGLLPSTCVLDVGPIHGRSWAVIEAAGGSTVEIRSLPRAASPPRAQAERAGLNSIVTVAGLRFAIPRSGINSNDRDAPTTVCTMQGSRLGSATST
jgi:hypothetical protein